VPLRFGRSGAALARLCLLRRQDVFQFALLQVTRIEEAQVDPCCPGSRERDSNTQQPLPQRSPGIDKPGNAFSQQPYHHQTDERLRQPLAPHDEQRPGNDVAPSVGYESDAAFSKAFKRVVGANPGEWVNTSNAVLEAGNTGMAEDT
jgi:AraC-like DNA-binding protein